jgi:hypothetical protein
MRTKFNNSELTHIWANQTQTHGTGSNMFFEYGSIYSYGYHFKLAQHMTNHNGQKCVLFNDKHYSNTTSKHQSLVWRSIPANVHFFKVKTIFEDINLASNAHLENLNNYLEYAEDAKKKAITATKLKNGFIEQTKAAIGVFDNYKAFFSLDGLIFEYQTINKRYSDIVNWLHDYQESKEFKQWQIKQEENKKKAEAKAIIDAKEKIEAFRQFKISSIYANFGHYLLRYNKETDNIETSGGVKLPKNVFLLAYQRLKNNTLEIGQHVGNFTYNGLKDGFLSVGCHKISVDEVENLIPELG